jgi:hypothetical protein
MRVLLFLLAFLLAAPLASAQIGVYAHVGLERTGFAPEALDVFTDTYNDYYSQRIETPFAAPDGSVTRPVLGVTARYADGLYAAFGYQYGRSTQTRSADLDGLGQQYELHVLDHSIHIELGMELGGGLYAGGVFSGLFRGESITFETVYPDGSVSIGNEVLPNGYFTATSPDFGYGLTVGFVRGRFAVPVRVVFPSKFFSTDELPLTDYDRQATRTYFPSDWARFLEDGSGFDDTNAVNDADFFAPHFSIGVEVRLLPF